MEKLIDNLVDYLPTLAFALIVLIAGYLISKLTIRLMSKGLSKSRIDATAHSFLKSLVQVVLYTIVIVITLTILKVPMTSIVAVIGAAGLAIGLSLQNSISNLAGGFIILFAKPFKVGDYIETGSFSGTVQAISILYTRLLTFDNKAVYIPNGQISSNTLINYNEEKTRRLDLVFSISYKDNFNTAKDIIKKAIQDNPLALSEPEPIIRVSEHASNSINIIAKIWVASENYWNLNYDLLETIKTEFDSAGISIPFNQLDVNIIK